ncbi:hypothetical protein [Sneathia sanguinegens]|uniref:hypothetical protein n=1 Tax=Sneathia sanguinegens TaxID=40543 RepID=UPI0023F6E849|nr:hypothetical protein [Sneathia sanguinegens]
MKKTFLLLASLITCAGFAHEGYVKTGIKVETEFIPRTKNEEKKIDESKFSYNKVMYDVNIIDFNMKFKKLGLDFGGVIKSRRNNLELNDWDNDKKHTEDSGSHEKNHDLMSKMYLTYESPEFFGLKSKTKIAYYPDKDMFKKDNKILSEYIENENEKQIAGNFLFDTNLSGKINNKINFNTNFKYKANQLAIFDKDEAYIKYDVKADGDINDKINLLTKYDLNYDLHFGSKPFDTFKTDLPSYPDYWTGNYVKNLKHNLELNVKYKVDKKNEVNVDFKTTMQHYLQGGETKTQGIRNIYSIINPVLRLGYNRNILKELKLGAELEENFEIRKAIYLPETKEDPRDTDIWAGLKPYINFVAKYKNNFIDYQGRIGYASGLTLAPIITHLENLSHSVKTENKLAINYEINEKSKLNSNLEANIEMPIKHIMLEPINTKLNVDLNFEHKFNDKLNLNLQIKNKLNLKSQKSVLDLDNYSENLKLFGKINYNIHDNLKLINELSYENKTTFNYYIDSDEKKEDISYVRIDSQKQLIFAKGESKFQTLLNRFKLDTKLDYEKKINEQLLLKAGLNLKTTLDLFALRENKIMTYKQDEVESNMEKPKASDYKNLQYNIGGKIEFIPSVGLEYKIMEKLILSSTIANKLEFGRKVVNLITEEDRPDKDSYGYIEKTFGFRSLAPSIEIKLEYRW